MNDLKKKSLPLLPGSRPGGFEAGGGASSEPPRLQPECPVTPATVCVLDDYDRWAQPYDESDARDLPAQKNRLALPCPYKRPRSTNRIPLSGLFVANPMQTDAGGFSHHPEPKWEP